MTSAQPTGTVTLDRDDTAVFGALSAYRVLLDGVEIGRVARVMETWERRSAGRRVVNARGRTPGWRRYVPGDDRGLHCGSRTQGVQVLLERAGVDLVTAERLAATTRNAR